MFPSFRANSAPISNATLLNALRSMGYDKAAMTVHGFRTMASTLLNEKGYNRDWIERQLAHGERNQVAQKHPRLAVVRKTWRRMTTQRSGLTIRRKRLTSTHHSNFNAPASGFRGDAAAVRAALGPCNERRGFIVENVVEAAVF